MYICIHMLKEGGVRAKERKTPTDPRTITAETRWTERRVAVKCIRIGKGAKGRTKVFTHTHTHTHIHTNTHTQTRTCSVSTKEATWPRSSTPRIRNRAPARSQLKRETSTVRR